MNKDLTGMSKCTEERVLAGVPALKRYQAPVLMKGPTLAAVTASDGKSISGTAPAPV